MLSSIRAMLVGVVLLSLAACSGDPEQDVSGHHTLRIGVPAQPASALLYIALEQGYFARHGIKVEPSYFPSGKRALLEGLLPGHLDVTATAEVSFVVQVMNGVQLKTFATIYMADDINRVVARRDAGIASFADLRGKRLATQKNSAVHYFAHRVMQENGLRAGDVSMVYRQAEDLPQGLAAREYEAFSMREPYVSQARALLGDDAVVLTSPGLFHQYEMLVYRGDRALPVAVQARLLGALLDAEAFAVAQPEAAMRLVATRLGVDVDSLRPSWRLFSLRVELEQAMLPGLELIAAWAIGANGLSPRPLNVLDHLDLAGMQRAAPERIGVID